MFVSVEWVRPFFGTFSYIVNNFVFLYRYFRVYRLGLDPFRASFRHTAILDVNRIWSCLRPAENV